MSTGDVLLVLLAVAMALAMTVEALGVVSDGRS